MVTGCEATPQTIAKTRRNARIYGGLYFVLGIAGIGLGTLAVTRGRASWADYVFLMTGVMWLGSSFASFKRSRE